MSAAIQHALREVKNRIPRAILELAFVPRTSRWRDVPISIDDAIEHQVIRPRVLVDCNLIGGTEVFISLSGVPMTQTNDFTCVYHIPKERTNGRSILSVLNITFSDPTKLSSYGVAAGAQNTPLMQVGQSVMDAMGSIPVVSTAYVQLIGENVVMVRDTVLLPANIYLRCSLANDENMNHLQIRTFRSFADMVVYAVKAYIYNKVIIELDQGEIYAGHNLGIIKEKVEEFKEAEELYQTFLTEKMQKILFMNDNETYKRFIRTKMGSSR